ncbi:MAG: hypothetical protein ACC667_10250 [Longimicrobiales bacterium]
MSMKTSNKRSIKGGILTAGLLSAVAFVPVSSAGPGKVPTALNGEWKIEATGARIIGGYGNNFAYDGANVRELRGTATVELNFEEGTGRVVAEVETTAQSGPIQFSSDQAWSGKIRIVQMLNLDKMAAARMERDVMLHGDTGNEAPVMPNIFNYFATWGPSSITVNGEEVIPMIGSHTMLSERSRGEDGAIRNGDGMPYSPMAPVKSGFTDASGIEFHVVAHTMQPDKGNFPPHTGWVHLNFGEVRIIASPDGEKIPYKGR